MKSKITGIAIFLVLVIAAFYIYSNWQKKVGMDAPIHRAEPILVDLYETNKNISFRGIDCIDDSIVWVSGSDGVFGKSLNYGEDWVFGRIPNVDGLELRDIELLSSAKALVMSSSVPSRIYKTADGGESWHEVFESNDSAMFLDGMAFCDTSFGVVFGDPINGKFVLIKTNNGGSSWEIDTANGPRALEGETAFAASGTSIQCVGGKSLGIATGGKAAQFIKSSGNENWEYMQTPIKGGDVSKGIFSFTANDEIVVAVGGDYKNDSLTNESAIFSLQRNEWLAGGNLPYQSCVTFMNDSVLVSVGTPGGYYSYDDGLSWNKFTEQSMHTLVKSQSGNLVYSAGANGRLAKIVFSKDQLED